MKNRIKMVIITGLILLFVSFFNLNSEEDMYTKFLKGKATVIYLEKERYYIGDLTEENNGRYVLCDITGDGKDELHLKTNRNYFVIEQIGDELIVIFDGSAYDNPVCNESMCGILYFREGGAPENYIYQFYDLGKHGEIEEHLEFRWYDDNEDESMDEKDMYIANGSSISMDEWIKQTEDYSDFLEHSTIQWKDWDIE